MAQSSITSTSMRLSRASRAAQTAVGARDSEIAEQRRGARIERRVSIAARLLRQRASHEAFADAGRSEHENVFVIRTQADFCARARITLLSNPREAR